MDLNVPPWLTFHLHNRSSLPRHRDTYPFIDPYRFRGSLSGQIALITNAHHGIGRATALDFASAGATCILTAHDSSLLQSLCAEIHTRYNVAAVAFTADFRHASVPTKLISQITAQIGLPHILINITPNASPSSFVLDEDFLNDWWKDVKDTLRPPIALIHAVLPGMIARGSGTIISTASASGCSHLPFHTADSTAKAALLRFHHGLDHEVRQKGIFSFVVDLGAIASSLANDSDVKTSHFAQEPRMQAELTEQLASVIEASGGWCAAGLASGTFLALCADPRAKCLSGLFLNAERDLGAVIEEMERGVGTDNRIVREGLYQLKVAQL